SVGVLTTVRLSTPFSRSAGSSCAIDVIWRRQNGQCRPRYKPTRTGLWPRKSSSAILPCRVIASRTTFGARSPGRNGLSASCSDMFGLLLRLVEERKHDKPLGLQSVPGAYLLRQLEIPLRLGHVAQIKAQCRQSIIARKKQLRLAGFSRHPEGLG